MIYRDQTPRKSQKSDPVGEVGLAVARPVEALMMAVFPEKVDVHVNSVRSGLGGR